MTVFQPQRSYFCLGTLVYREKIWLSLGDALLSSLFNIATTPTHFVLRVVRL